MKRGQAWFFGIFFLFFAVFFFYALSPIMQNIISQSASSIPASQVAFGGLLLVFLLVAIAFTFWKIIAPASS